MFIIIEIQKSNLGSVAIVPPASYSDHDHANQAYHTALAAAAVSQVDVHSVVMLDDTGARIKGESYYHGQTPGAES